MDQAHFRCRLSASTSSLPHVWEHTVGSCHAPIALRADWQQQLRRCHDELGFQYVRFHGLLSDDVGTLICHRDELLYSFFNADRIVDFLLSIDMRPFVELSFMPRALASGNDTVFSYRGNISPPADYQQWAELIRRLVRHWTARYGRDEVRQWYFEVWNEPNLRAFWAGTREQYYELYRHTVEAIKGVDAELRVGGPATAANAWLPEFLDFCRRSKLPVDFVSTHHYPNDALWSDAQDTESELAGGQRGILREWTRQARQQAGDLTLLYTEWNASSNPRYPPQDEPYAAAFAVKSALEASEFVQAYAFWTFTDIFEENYFPSRPFHGGFGLLNLHGIPKPVYRAFELMHRLGTERLPMEGTHATVDAWATKHGKDAMILLANHALPRHPIATQRIRLELLDSPPPRSATLERIDDSHANAKAAWQALGEPEYLNPTQERQLEEAARLVRESWPCRYEERTAHLEIELPPHGIAALTIELEGHT